MKILQVNTVYSGGGAADIARRLHVWMNQQPGLSSRFLYGRGSAPPDAVRISNPLEVAFSIFCTRTMGKSCNFLFDSRIEREVQAADVVHLHNLHGYYLNWERMIRLLAELNKPVVWSFHDLWPLTGRCAIPNEPYPDECSRWLNGCGKCPHLNIYPRTVRDLSAQLWNKKRQVFHALTRENTILVAPSYWLRDCIAESFMKDYPLEVIPHGIAMPGGLTWDKESLRRKLGLPIDAQLLLFAAADIQNPGKGLRFLLEILDDLPDSVKVVSVGKRSTSVQSSKWIPLGYVAGKEALMNLYRACDLYINPTLGEVFSLTTAEALANRLPVVGFNTPPLPEVVGEECGILVEKGNVRLLKEAILHLLSDEPLRLRLSENAGQRYQNLFTEDRFGMDYMKLYYRLSEPS